MKDLTKKERFIVVSKKGYVNADWINGKRLPECWGFSHHDAISYTRQRAEMLQELCEYNGNNTILIQIL